MARRFWIDLATPPQVLFFRPIWQELRRRNQPCLVTVRNFNRAPELASQFGIPHLVVGRHGGRGTLRKAVALLRRVAELVVVARHFAPELAVSHNSYAQAVAARLLGVPLLTAMDYEHQPANHLSFRLAKTVLVPQPFPESALRRYGAAAASVVRYPGIKEEVYLADFRPDVGLPERLGLPANRVVVTVRPPARTALYHRFDNPVFEALLARVAADPSAHVLLVDRAEADWSRFPSVQVLPFAVDGPSLLWWSDLLIGGGGTMTREAAVLGTPAYSVFAGRPSAVDDYLVACQRMTRVARESDFDAVQVRKKIRQTMRPRSDGLNRIIEVLLDLPSHALAP
jgi:predicted glycosyltransferase